MKSVKVLVPSGMIGNGFNDEAFANGVRCRPDVIAVDGGSTDPGPYYLGSGVAKNPDASLKYELRKMMEARAQLGVPLIIGSCGTSGADTGVDLMARLAMEIAEEQGMSLKMACIYSEQQPEALVDALRAGAITPLAPARDLGEEDIRACSRIVAAMGVEPIMHALEQGCDVVLAGRSTDTAVMAALPILRGVAPGPAWHAGKILECGGTCTTNPSTYVVMAEVDSDGFTIRPMGANTRATPRSVHAHMLYENTNPNILVEPGGVLDVSEARYDDVNGTDVRVTHSRWTPSAKYTVKLEGVRVAGYQAVSMNILREPAYVNRFDEWIVAFEKNARASIEKIMGLKPAQYALDLRAIGVNATLGALEREVAPSHVEIGVMAVITTDNPRTTREIAALLNAPFLHLHLPDAESVPTHGLPFSPSIMDRGMVYEFALNHVLAVEDPLSPFRFKYIDVVEGKTHA